MKNLFMIPLVSFAFLMFLPLVGFVLFAQALMMFACKQLDRVWATLAIPVPVGRSFLAGAAPNAASVTDLGELKNEIESKRSSAK